MYVIAVGYVYTENQISLQKGEHDAKRRRSLAGASTTSA